MNKPNEAELRAALRAKAPSDEERRAWARTALAMAGRRGSGGRAWRRLAGVAAAAAVLVAAALLLRRGPERTPNHAEPGDTGPAAVEKERAANESYLDKSGGALAAAPKGHFAVIVGGDTIRVGPDLDELLAWADKGWPAARHRYVIRVDPEIPLGDVVCDTGPVPETGAGLGFLQLAGVKVGGEAGAWTVEHGGRTVTLEGGKPVLPVQVNGKTVRLALDKESLAPLVLPAESLSPRFELPGETILEGLDRAWWKYRRHLVKVHHEALGIDGWYEAVAAPGEWVAVRLGGHVIRGLEPGKEPEGPYFVLHYRVEDVDRLDTLFGALDDLGPYERYAVPGAAASKIALVHPTSRDAMSGEILDLANADAAALRRFLAPEREAKSPPRPAGADEAARLEADAVALAEDGRDEEAAKAFREAIRREPGSARAHANLAVILARLGRLEEALAASEEALRLDPESLQAQRNHAAILGMLDRVPEALAAMERVFDGRDAADHALFAFLLEREGRREAAAAARARAREIDPDVADGPPMRLLGGAALVALPPRTAGGLAWEPWTDPVRSRGVATGKPLLLLCALPGRELPEAALRNLPGVDRFAGRFWTPVPLSEPRDDLGRGLSLVPGAAAGLEVRRGSKRVAWMFLTETTTAEVVGAFLDEALLEMQAPVEIGGHSWAPRTRFAFERARRAGKPALVLVHRAGEAGRFAQLLRALPGLDRYVLLHREGEGDLLERHEPDGRVTGQALPADLPVEDLWKRVRAFLAE